MEFTAMDELSYRSLGADEYEQRRSEVIGFAKELPEDATEEQANAIDAELGLIDVEDKRRSQLAEIEQRNMEKVIAGNAKPVEAAVFKEESMERASSLGENFVQYRKGHQSPDNRIIAPAFNARTAGDPTTTGSFSLTPTEFSTDVVGKPVASLAFLDLFGRKQISAPVYSWNAYSSTTGSAGTTAEGVAKNKLTYEYVQKTATLQKVTGLIKMTEELFEDAPYVADAINTDLVNDLNAARQAAAMATLLATSGVQTASVTYSTVIDIFNGILAAAADIEEDTGIAADAVVVTPAIWLILRSALDNENRYYAGNPFGSSEYSKLFEMTFVKNSSLTANHILVGACAQGADLVSKADGVRVDSTNSNDVDFEKNLVSVRAEAREIVAVKRPACFCNITVSATGATGATGATE